MVFLVAIGIFDVDPTCVAERFIAGWITMATAIAVPARYLTPCTESALEILVVKIHRVRVAGTPDHRSVMFHKGHRAPIRYLLPVQQRHEAATINIRRDGGASE